MYFEYTPAGSFVNDIESEYFDIVRELNNQDDFANALADGDLNTYYALLRAEIGDIESGNADQPVIPQPEERFIIYRKLINYFILSEIDPLEYIGTSVPEGMFYGCDFITSVSLPDQVTQVSNFAFAFCPNLRTLNLSNSLQTLASWIIVGTRITGLNIPDNFRVQGCSSTCFFTGNGFGNDPRSLQQGLHFSSRQKEYEFWNFENNN